MMNYRAYGLAIKLRLDRIRKVWYNIIIIYNIYILLFIIVNIIYYIIYLSFLIIVNTIILNILYIIGTYYE